MIALFGGKEVMCGAYKLFGSKELSEEVIASLGSLKACLMANHGAIVVSADIDDAFFLAQELEHLSQQYIELLKIGELNLLSDDEMDKVIHKFQGYGPKA
jgi:L-fuculose-phosphate aldolase